MKKLNIKNIEIIKICLTIIIISIVSCFFSFLISLDFNETLIFGEFKLVKGSLLPSFIIGLGSNLLFYLIILPLHFIDERINTNKIKLIFMIILSLLGILAYVFITSILVSYKLSLLISLLIASLIELTYIYFIVKLYLYNHIEDKSPFYEIIRFALVGVIASLFDFATCYIFQYYILVNLQPVWITIISVTMGFIVGVIVNYLCSIFMVFKATTNKDKSRTAFGRFLFVFLAAIGLFMGMGLQYLFFNFLKLGYVLTFIIRTLIVLIWNYVSRKLFIFK